MSAPIIFDGSIPQQYEDYLTPFLFDSFAEDIVSRVAVQDVTRMLELACGTGIVTRRLVERLSSAAQLTATDLQADMLEVAASKVHAAGVTWATVDMTDIPYGDQLFDGIVCQFGLMLVTDKLRAVREMYRVLKPGGQLLFNVWGDINENQVWRIGGEVIDSFIGVNPMLQDPGPFSLDTDRTLLYLNEAGFSSINVYVISRMGSVESAEMAAKGFAGGLPVFANISKKNPSLVPVIQQALARELERQLGSQPLRSSLQALVFEVYK